MKLKLQSFRSIYNLPLQEHNYDTNSYLIGIDNHTSALMTKCKSDFIDNPKLVNVSIKGTKGQLLTSKTETVRWIIQDDKGRPHKFDIPGTYLVPELSVRLLSPQHAAKEILKQDKQPDSMICTTFSDRVLLSWNNGRYCQTIPLGRNNVPIVRYNPAYDVPYSTTNPWCNQIINSCSAYIPDKASNKQYL
jgi:hypothetical protein